MFDLILEFSRPFFRGLIFARTYCIYLSPTQPLRGCSVSLRHKLCAITICATICNNLEIIFPHQQYSSRLAEIAILLQYTNMQLEFDY